MPVMMSAYRGVVLALLLAACAAGASGDEPVSVSGTWKWDLNWPDSIWLKCESSGEQTGAEQLEDAQISPFNRTEMQLKYPDTNITMLGANLLIMDCPLPRGSFKDALAALQYPVAEIQRLSLSALSVESRPLRAEHFAGLHLKELKIEFKYTVHQHITPDLSPDIFSSLPELTNLRIYGANLPPMPSTSLLRTVVLTGGRSTGAWGGCSELRELILINWEVRATKKDAGLLAHCPQLTSIRAQWMTPDWLVRVLTSTRGLTSLHLKDEQGRPSTMQLDSIFSGLPLQQLTFPYEMFTQVSENTLSTSLEKLTLVQARWTTFTQKENNKRVVRKLTQLPKLQELVVDPELFVYQTDFCNLFSENSSLPALRRLTLAESTTPKLCFSGWDSLEYLNLRDNEYLYELELVQLPRARAHPLVVDLSGAVIRRIPLHEAGYNLLKDRFDEATNVTIMADIKEIDCDCEHGWVARALRTLPLYIIPGVRCKALDDDADDNSGASLLDVPAEQLECERFDCGWCTCRHAWRDNATTAMCERWVWAVPHAPGLRALHAAGSHIDTLHADDLPDTLLTLNLRNSKISRLDQPAVDALFSVSARMIWLAGNPLACDCAARTLLSALQRHRSQVQDFNVVTCADGRALHALAVDELCSTS